MKIHPNNWKKWCDVLKTLSAVLFQKFLLSVLTIIAVSRSALAQLNQTAMVAALEAYDREALVLCNKNTMANWAVATDVLNASLVVEQVRGRLINIFSLLPHGRIFVMQQNIKPQSYQTQSQSFRCWYHDRKSVFIRLRSNRSLSENIVVNHLFASKCAIAIISDLIIHRIGNVSLIFFSLYRMPWVSSMRLCVNDTLTIIGEQPMLIHTPIQLSRGSWSC